MASVANSAVSGNVLPYFAVAIKASFFKFNMCDIYTKTIFLKCFYFFLNSKLLI